MKFFSIRNIHDDEMVQIFAEDYDGNRIVDGLICTGEDVKVINNLMNLLSENGVGFSAVGRLVIVTLEGNCVDISRPRTHRSRYDTGSWRPTGVKAGYGYTKIKLGMYDDNNG